MDSANTIFRKKSIVLSKLEPYGFAAKGSSFVYQKALPGSGFLLSVTVSHNGQVSTEMLDPSTNEPYTLHLVDGAVGSFVGMVRAQYEEILSDIAEKCCEPDVFQTNLARALIEYVRGRYGNELEYLWEKFPSNAIWRRSDTGKWYGALLTVSKQKLGIQSDEMAEIIDLRAEPEKLPSLLRQKGYFPGWHMNKKHWYTILLDGSVPLEEICRRIDDSYRFAAKK